MPSNRRDCPRFELAPDHVAVLGRFDSKKALYLALLAKHAEQLPRFVDPTVGDEQVPRPVLVDLVTRTIRGVLQPPR
jgi:hypothetical protein